MPCVFQVVVPFLVILIIFLAPESPRFLVGKGRPEEALRILAKYHANGNEDDPLVQLEFQEIVVALESEGEEKDTSWLDLVRTPGNRRRIGMVVLIGVGTNWVGDALMA